MRQNNFFGQKLNLIAFGVDSLAKVNVARGIGMMRTKAKETVWWINVGIDQQTRADEIVSKLKSAGVEAKMRVVGGPQPDNPQAPSGAPAFEQDPRDVMVAAYRKMEWQRQQKEFTASAPQRKVSNNLPPSRTPELRKQQARSVGEELTLRLIREGKIPS